MDTLDWPTIDTAADALHVSEFARKKWRQRGIPSKWWLPIARELGVPPEALEAFNRGPSA